MFSLSRDLNRAQGPGIELSEQQLAAAADIRRWRSTRRSPFYHLSGYAGVGKTTLMTALKHELYGSVSYVALTGKAASLLPGATTIHRFLYDRPTVIRGKDGRDELRWVTKEDPRDADLIIADESSMIDQKLGADLLALRIPLLATGDPFQLPPISGKPYFSGQPDFTLSEIHRMAQDSPVLEMAVAIHAGEPPKPIKFDEELAFNADIIICALNATRRRLNRMWRRAHGINDRYPQVDDRVLCFRTNYRSGVFNGELWTIRDCRDNGGLLELRLVDDLGVEAEVFVPEKDFLLGPPKVQTQSVTDSFDYGYCVTAHKSQGSEWPHVVVIDETASPRFRYMAGNSGLHPNEFRDRWLYTSVTRASRRVDIMEPPR